MAAFTHTASPYGDGRNMPHKSSSCGMLRCVAVRRHTAVQLCPLIIKVSSIQFSTCSVLRLCTVHATIHGHTSMYGAICPRACVDVRQHTQCERVFSLLNPTWHTCCKKVKKSKEGYSSLQASLPSPLRTHMPYGKEGYSSLQASLPSPLRTHMPYGITQCYLPPGRGDITAFTPAEAGTQFSDPGGMQGWVDLGGWLEMVYPHNGHPSWTNRARCWLTSLMRPRR